MIIPIVDSLRYENISDEQYFSDKYSEYISNSRLSLINPEQNGSEELYLTNSHKSSPSLILGSAIHCITLQPNEFIIANKCGRPTAKLGQVADYLYVNYYKPNKAVSDEQVIEASNVIDYYKDKMNNEKIKNVYSKCYPYWETRFLYEIKSDSFKEPIFLDDSSYDKAISCINSLNQNKNIQTLLNPSEAIIMNEAALFMDFLYKNNNKECILKFKAKLDNFTIKENCLTLNDLKTTGHYVDQFKESFEKYHYYRQVGVYAYLLKIYAQKYHNISEIDSLKCNLLLVSTIPNYKSKIFKVTKYDIERGWNEFVKLMNLVGDVTTRRI